MTGDYQDHFDQLATATTAYVEDRVAIATAIRALRHLRDDRLNVALRLAHDVGFTLEQLGDMIGVSRERVRQLIAAGPGSTPERKGDWPIPQACASYLQELQASAATVRGGTPPDAPSRKASTEYTELLSALRTRGHSYDQMAEASNVTKHAIAARLRGVPVMYPSAAAEILDRATAAWWQRQGLSRSA